MVSPELIDELRVVQLRVNDLAVSDIQLMFPNQSYEVWSPYDSAGAALKLQQMLDEDKRSQNG